MDTVPATSAATAILVCANLRARCANAAKLTCSGCRLVQYCSKECQRAHWNDHSLICKSSLPKENWEPTWVANKRLPAFIVGKEGAPVASFGMNKYLWGNMPAYDHINLAKNEGNDWNKPLDLCFAASGDLRNIIVSLNCLPATFTAPCNIVVNDYDMPVVLRNLLLLLAFSSFPAAEAAKFGLHLWYSAKLPAATQSKLRETFKEKLEKIRVHMEKAPETPDATLLSTTLSLGEKSQMHCILPRAYWKRLFQMLDFRLASGEATEKRRLVTMNRVRGDYRERHLYILPPGCRMSKLQYYDDGLLLPFGVDRRGFTEPNFTLFDIESRKWMLNDSADPFNCWNCTDVMASSEKLGLPKNDIFGALYFHLIPQFEQFSRRLQKDELNLTLLSVDARKLESALVGSVSKHHIKAFDRIDVSNIVDRCYVGLHDTLDLLGRLLKTRAENPHAALITLFMNYHEEQGFNAPLDSQAMDREVKEIMKLMSVSKPRDQSDPVLLKVLEWRGYLQDFDKTWEQYKQVCFFDLTVQRNGMVPRAAARIIANRPYAIDLTGSKEDKVARFQAHDIAGLRGHERYVEWERAV